MFNMFLIGSSWFNNTIHRFLLWIDLTVYSFASRCYQLFMKLATAQIFDDSFFSGFANRIYAILGVFMLFYLVYALLNAIVDPDKISKGDKSTGKIAMNLITSLVMLGLLPSIFTYAYRMQNFILSSNLLGAVILGSDVVDVSDTSSQDGLMNFGDYVSFTVLNTFLNPEDLNPTLEDGKTWEDVKNGILQESEWGNLTLMTNAVSSGVAVNGENVSITYSPIISTLAGAFLVYMMLSFTLDLGVRVVKFAFYQLLAPIPIILRVIPNKKGTFDKWLKQTISVYFEAFVRVGLMYIAIYFINAIANDSTIVDTWLKHGGVQGKLAFAIVIMGIFVFVKQAPKIISDVLGIETGNLKLGIGEKLKAGGFFGASALLGAGVTGLVRGVSSTAGNIFRNGRQMVNSFKNDDVKGLAKNTGKTIASAFTGIGSTIYDSASGMYHAYGSAKKAGSFGDVRKAAAEGAQKSWDNKVKREKYIASNNGFLGSVAAKAADAYGAAKEWATGTPLNDFLTRVKFKEDFYKEFDEYKTLYENPEYNAMDAQLNHLKSLKAQGATKDEQGNPIDTAIENMKNSMTNKRLEAIKKNKDAAAYIAYNMAKFAKDNYSLYNSKDVDFDFNGKNIEDFVLKENKVYHRDGVTEWSAAELMQLYENANSGDYDIDNGNIKIKDSYKGDTGMKSQIGASKAALKAAKQTPAYKEAAKKESAKK